MTLGRAQSFVPFLHVSLRLVHAWPQFGSIHTTPYSQGPSESWWDALVSGWHLAPNMQERWRKKKSFEWKYVVINIIQVLWQRLVQINEFLFLGFLGRKEECSGMVYWYRHKFWKISIFFASVVKAKFIDYFPDLGSESKFHRLYFCSWWLWK